jgi:hypothetical protein
VTGCIAASLALTLYTLWTRAYTFSSGTSTVLCVIILHGAVNAIRVITIRIAAIVTVIIETFGTIALTAFIVALQL